MDEEENWDLPTASPKAPTTTSSSNSGAHQTLKITDGYKYSYEALASPANINDWVETPSYGGSRRSNGYGEGRSFRQERNSSNRFDPMKRNDSFSQNNSSFSKSFGTPKPRFSNRPPVPVSHDWDTPDASASQMNGAWKPPAAIATPSFANTPAVDEESWDEPTGGSSGYKPPTPAVDIPLFHTSMPRQIHTPTPQSDNVAVYSPSFSRPSNSSTSVVNNSAAEDHEESWDDTPSANPAADIPMFRPSSMPSIPQQNHSIRTPEPEPRPSKPRTSNEDMEESWDDEPSDERRPQPAMDIPIFKPPSNHSSGSNSPVVRAAMPTPTPSAKAADVEENWDDDAPAPVAQEIPTFRPSNRAQDSDDQKSDASGSTKTSLPKGFGQKGFGGGSGFGGSGFGGSGDRERDRSWDRGSKGFGGDKGFGGNNRDRDRRFSGGDRRGRGFGNSNDRFNDRGGRRTEGGERGFGRSNDRFSDRGGDRSFGKSNDRGFGNSNDRGFGNSNDRGFSNSNDRGFGKSNDRGFGKSNDRGFGNSNDRFGNSSERGFGNSNDRGFGKSNDRGFGGGDRDFSGREPFGNRHSRGNRHNPYERNGDRGDRGGRGRGGRGGRGGFRDNGDKEWGNKSFGRQSGFRDSGRGNDREWAKPFGRSLADRNKNDNGSPSFASPATSFSSKTAEDVEENWDDEPSPAPKAAESRPAEPKPASNSFVPPPIETAPAASQNDEESWD